MTDLVTWLRAQLDDDERLAPSKHYDPDGEGGYHSCPATRTEPYGDLPYGEENCDCTMGQRRIRVLAEVDAKRRILHLHSWDSSRDSCATCAGYTPTPCPTVRLLALPYADRAGFDPAWAPVEGHLSGR